MARKRLKLARYNEDKASQAERILCVVIGALASYDNVLFGMLKADLKIAKNLYAEAVVVLPDVAPPSYINITICRDKVTAVEAGNSATTAKGG